MKIMCIGDVVSRTGREMLFRYIADYRQNHGVDFVIANGENATHGRGLAYPAYNEIMRAGVDVLTLGNHAWGAKDVVQIMERKGNVIRPANFSSRCPGSGSLVMRTKSGTEVGIINLIGRTFMPRQVDSPFDAADREIEKLKEPRARNLRCSITLTAEFQRYSAPTRTCKRLMKRFLRQERVISRTLA